jgi:hypothetical protein
MIFWSKDWVREPFYSRHKDLVNWMSFALMTQMFQKFGGMVVGYIVTPVIYSDRMVRGEKTDAQLHKLVTFWTPILVIFISGI